MDLFDCFLQERRYLKGVSKDTLRWYRGVQKTFAEILAQPTKSGLLRIVQRLLDQGIAPISVNTYLRGFRTSLNWLHENGHLDTPFKVPLLKTEQKILQTLSSDQVKRILRYTPKGRNERRVHTFICLCLDTGLRLSEALSLAKDNVDLDNLVIRVRGKGNKHRLVPFSLECRKVLIVYDSAEFSGCFFNADRIR
jgi:site-specific recombinase XerD